MWRSLLKKCAQCERIFKLFSEPCLLFEKRRLVGLLPRKVDIFSAHMSIGRRLLINRAAQAKRFNNCARAQVKVLIHQSCYFVLAYFLPYQTYQPAPRQVLQHRLHTQSEVRSGQQAPPQQYFFATYRAAYAALRSTFVGSLPERRRRRDANTRRRYQQ